MVYAITTKQPINTLCIKAALQRAQNNQKWMQPSLIIRLLPSLESTFRLWNRNQFLSVFGRYVGTLNVPSNIYRAHKASSMDGKVGDGPRTVCAPHHYPIPPPHQSRGSSGLCPKPSARTTSQQCPPDKDRTGLHQEPVQPTQTLHLIDAEHQTCMLYGPRRKHQQCLQSVEQPKHTGMARGNVSTQHT